MIMAHNSQVGSQRVCYPVGIHPDYKQSSLPKRPWFHQQAGLNQQETVQQIGENGSSTRWLYGVESHPLDSRTPSLGELYITGS